MPWELRVQPPPDPSDLPSSVRPEEHAASPDAHGASALPTSDQLAQDGQEVRRHFGLSLWICALVIATDQLAKALVRATLAPFESRTIIPGLLDFIHVQNTGVAFGILNDSTMNHQLKSMLTTALAGLALVGIAFYARHVHNHEKLARVGLSLILGGAVGNLVDRLRVHYVLDYVDVYWHGWHFWAFNIADASITIGAVLVFLDLLLVTRHAPHPV
jgi:signal peptidase II